MRIWPAMNHTIFWNIFLRIKYLENQQSHTLFENSVSYNCSTFTHTSWKTIKNPAQLEQERRQRSELTTQADGVKALCHLSNARQKLDS